MNHTPTFLSELQKLKPTESNTKKKEREVEREERTLQGREPWASSVRAVSAAGCDLQTLPDPIPVSPPKAHFACASLIVF